MVVVSALLVAACAPTPEVPLGSSARKPVSGSNRLQVLESHNWRLQSAVGPQNQRIAALSPQDIPPIVFGFGGDRINIQGGCNQMGGRYRIAAASQIEVDQIVSTRMACKPELMQTDAALSTLLAKPLQIEVIAGASPQLRLVSASNETLAFAGSLTREAQFGPPTVIFLEVAPEHVACDRAPAVGARCLHVRQLYFDEKGLPAGKPGEWRALYEDIEGFRHAEGERNVLRVKRFNRAQPAAGTVATLYVIDLIVESGPVNRRQ